MAEMINGYTITASNASKSQSASVTVKAPTGNVAARIFSEHSQPLKWLRRWPHSLERAELVAQLRKHGVDQETIQAIVSM